MRSGGSLQQLGWPSGNSPHLVTTIFSEHHIYCLQKDPGLASTLHSALSLLRPTLGDCDKKLVLFQWQLIPSVFRTFWFTDVIEKVLEELLMEQDDGIEALG